MALSDIVVAQDTDLGKEYRRRHDRAGWNETLRMNERAFFEDLPVSPLRMLEVSPNGWLLIDAEGVIRFTNSQISEMSGFGREDLIGEHIEVLVPERVRSKHLEHRANYFANPTSRPIGVGMDLTALRKDGSEFPVEISLSPVETRRGLFVAVIVRDITERVRLEDERNTLRLELEIERERDRIGLDLHDGIMQEIYGVGLTLDLALADVRERPDVAEDGIERSINQLHEVIRNIRNYIFDLRPRQVAGSLAVAVVELAREFHQNTGINVVEDVDELLLRIKGEHASTAYHIVREALSNVRNHSEATLVTVRMKETAGQIVIDVIDNGRGFEPDSGMLEANGGLSSMHAHAQNTGCNLEVRSAPGKGTTVTVRVPTFE